VDSELALPAVWASTSFISDFIVDKDLLQDDTADRNSFSPSNEINAPIFFFFAIFSPAFSHQKRSSFELPS